MGAIKEFLTFDHAEIDGMAIEDLAAECAGWRTIAAMVPKEVMELVALLGQPFCATTRKYEAKNGILTGVRFEVVEYQIEVLEASFDALRGVRLVEAKVLNIPEDAVLYTEEIQSSQDYLEWEVDANLAGQSLDLEAVHG